MVRVHGFVMYRFWSHGVRRGSSVWLALGVASMAARLLKRLGQPEVIRYDLREGQTLLITHQSEPS